jgi:hypothetical protein
MASITRSQLPIHHSRGKQENHRQAFANNHLDRIGRARDHGHIEGDARDQMPGYDYRNSGWAVPNCYRKSSPAQQNLGQPDRHPPCQARQHNQRLRLQQLRARR